MVIKISYDVVIFNLTILSLKNRRSLITGRPESSNLIIKIIRNTSILEQHETALVDLCILPEGELYSGGRDKTIDKCIETMYKAAYDMDDSDMDENNNICNDEDMECMLETISSLWSEDMGMYGDGNQRKEDDENKVEEVKKPAPWSSRSSPSGTWVRVNGTMVNIDE